MLHEKYDEKENTQNDSMEREGTKMIYILSTNIVFTSNWKLSPEVRLAAVLEEHVPKLWPKYEAPNEQKRWNRC